MSVKRRNGSLKIYSISWTSQLVEVIWMIVGNWDRRKKFTWLTYEIGYTLQWSVKEGIFDRWNWKRFRVSKSEDECYLLSTSLRTCIISYQFDIFYNHLDLIMRFLKFNCELKQSGKKEYCHLGCYHLFYAYRRKLIKWSL